MKPLLNMLKKEKTFPIPLWFMRQAGRYLPEYRKIRANTGSFLDMCYNPSLAAEITLQPITRFGCDGAIFFSDILVIPAALGKKVEFREKEGPYVERLTFNERFPEFDPFSFRKNLALIYEGLALTKEKLPSSTSLIGFAGAPWTIATYMIEGKVEKDATISKRLAYEDPDYFSYLIHYLTHAVTEHLLAQIEHGAEIVQIFDSWAGYLSFSERKLWVFEPLKKIIKNIKEKYPHIPVIAFPRGIGMDYEAFVKTVNADAISLDYTLSRKWVAEKLQPYTTLQGNLDPCLFFASFSRIEAEIDNMLECWGRNNFIFNLGHGILPETPIEKVQFTIDTLRKKTQ